ncbi:MAG: AAA family ATPase [Sulfuricurvum sp.]|uniref:AAA family ATPase n=1 Tax=Sulfuricurvum sp. TaxID=2025608 RepID=UPI00262A92B9|nr:AAA family ATPase [Sulfuricurvum sp.]MDD2368157.1 AAA family ATPase [Sulfuricurvum sp.]MDD5117044.1 AAA family ATPase [Sulfuricurvum sp.]
MELVYLWVEEYKNIYHQGFNFSPKFECEFKDEYDEDGKLKDKCELIIKPKENIENFFGENINVAAIVGENGSGKSRLFDLLCRLSLEFLYNERIIVIFWNETILSCEFFNINDINFINKSEITYKDIYKKADSTQYGLNGVKSLYFENNSIIHLTESHIDPLIQYKNTANFNYLGNYKTINNNNIILLSDILFTFNENLLIYRAAFEDIQKVFEQLSLKLPTVYVLYIQIEDYEIRANNFIQALKKHGCAPQQCSEIKQKMDAIEETIGYEEKIWLALLLSQYISSQNLVPIINSERAFIESYKRTHEVEPCIEEYFNTQNEYDGSFAFLTEFENIKKFIEKTKQLGDIHWSQSQKVWAVLANKIDDEFIQLYSKLTTKQIIKFDMLDETTSPIIYSSGEITFLNLFFKLYSIKIHSFDNLTNNVTILFDEIELYLHPNWQKFLFGQLLKILEFVFPPFVKIHLLIATHSPFILSDIPKENVIFLEKDEATGNCINVTTETKIDTFGANIHTLLSHGFFMKDGLMGEFAKGKITEILNFLNDKEALKTIQENQIKPIIESIGEDFLRNKLLNLYRKKLSEDEKEKEKQSLKDKIDELIRQYDELSK